MNKQEAEDILAKVFEMRKGGVMPKEVKDQVMLMEVTNVVQSIAAFKMRMEDNQHAWNEFLVLEAGSIVPFEESKKFFTDMVIGSQLGLLSYRMSFFEIDIRGRKAVSTVVGTIMENINYFNGLADSMSTSVGEILLALKAFDTEPGRYMKYVKTKDV